MAQQKIRRLGEIKFEPLRECSVQRLVCRLVLDLHEEYRLVFRGYYITKGIVKEKPKKPGQQNKTHNKANDKGPPPMVRLVFVGLVQGKEVVYGFDPYLARDKAGGARDLRPSGPSGPCVDRAYDLGLRQLLRRPGAPRAAWPNSEGIRRGTTAQISQLRVP